jgi:hypothetical protein
MSASDQDLECGVWELRRRAMAGCRGAAAVLERLEAAPLLRREYDEMAERLEKAEAAVRVLNVMLAGAMREMVVRGQVAEMGPTLSESLQAEPPKPRCAYSAVMHGRRVGFNKDGLMVGACDVGPGLCSKQGGCDCPADGEGD